MDLQTKILLRKYIYKNFLFTNTKREEVERGGGGRRKY